MSRILIAISFIAIFGSACSKNNSSSVKLDNGIRVLQEDANTIPGVTYIFSSVPGAQMGGACTATFVSDNTLVTASHCIFDAASQSILTLKIRGSLTSSDGKDLTALKVFKTDGFSMTLDESGKSKIVSPYSGDLAVAIFPANSFKHFFEVSAEQLNQPDKVLMVGYSQKINYNEPNPENSDQKGAKRWVKNKIERSDATNGYTSLVGTDSNAGGVSQGDSGGPLFDMDCRLRGTASSRGQGINLHSGIAFNLPWMKSLESQGAYFCGLSGSDSAHCGTGKNNPIQEGQKTTDEREIFPCNSDKINADQTPIIPPVKNGDTKIPSDIKIKMHDGSLSDNPMAFFSAAKQATYMEICAASSVDDCTTSNASYKKITDGFNLNSRRVLYLKMDIAKTDGKKDFVVIVKDAQDAVVSSRVFSLKSN